MIKEELPKKILMIKDCAFILPDDFEGNIEDAFTQFLEYRATHLQNASFVDDSNLFSAFDILLHKNDDLKVCGQYAIYELVDGTYKISKDQHI